MSRMFVRTTWASDLNRQSRAALQELADGEKATVSGHATGTTEDGSLNVNHATATMFLKKGYAELNDDDTITITRNGLVKIGRATISRAERQRKQAAKSLRAQETGEWVPVPAGYSAAAERDARDTKRFWAAAVSALHGAMEHVERERKMLLMAKSWGADEDELDACQEDVEKAEGRVVEAKDRLDSLRGDQQQAA